MSLSSFLQRVTGRPRSRRPLPRAACPRPTLRVESLEDRNLCGGHLFGGIGGGFDPFVRGVQQSISQLPANLYRAAHTLYRPSQAYGQAANIASTRSGYASGNPCTYYGPSSCGYVQAGIYSAFDSGTAEWANRTGYLYRQQNLSFYRPPTFSGSPYPDQARSNLYFHGYTRTVDACLSYGYYGSGSCARPADPFHAQLGSFFSPYLNRSW